MTTPNVFQYATSELSQDAVIAYMIAWAKPEFKESHPELNQLGENLLKKLLDSSAEVQGKANPLTEHTVLSLEVGTQRDHIDIWVEINDTIFLIIEDKVHSKQHSDQIAKYINTVRNYQTKNAGNWEIMVVYLKTGNESRCSFPNNELCGIFLREDILEVLAKTPVTDNTIIEEFRKHLHKWQQETESYLSAPVKLANNEFWNWAGVQGYYIAVEDWLNELHQQFVSKGECDAGWGYVSNRSGGFLGFWWHWRNFEAKHCHIYLQIEQGKRLQVRVSNFIDQATGEHIKTNNGLLWQVFQKLQVTAQQDQFQEINVKKSGRFKGGWYSAVADIQFDGENSSYLGLDGNGILDFTETKLRLLKAMDLVDHTCS